MNLLIVNDVELTVRFLQEQISWKVYGITGIYVAYSAEEAKTSLLQNPIDIILCDIEMPGENGIELIQWVQKNKIPCDCVFLTCHANFDYILEALHLECQDYILFPSPAEDIGNAIAKAVNRRKESMRNDALKEYGRQWVEAHVRESAMEGQRDIISEAMEYILENISSPMLSVKEIADHNYLSISYLSRSFKKAKGLSISAYIIQVRMELAGQLLLDTSDSVANIALETGYDNPPYFTATFKKYYGCTPSQFREQHTQDNGK